MYALIDSTAVMQFMIKSSDLPAACDQKSQLASDRASNSFDKALLSIPKKTSLFISL